MIVFGRGPKSGSRSVFVYFSRIKINIIKIKNAFNDCIDVSGGNYQFNIIDVDSCFDKGLSIGEASKVNIKNAQKSIIEWVNLSNIEFSTSMINA